MFAPLFIATERFDPSDGEKWQKYCNWAEIPGLAEVVSLDALLCKHLITEFQDEDWGHIVNENFRLDYFYHLDYLKQRIQDIPRRNILGLYRNPEAHIAAPPWAGGFQICWLRFNRGADSDQRHHQLRRVSRRVPQR